MTASIRREPAPTELSERIANGPISAVERTCVPPQSSTDQPSTSTTRTTSPYFSPNSIIAPRFARLRERRLEDPHRQVREDVLVDALLDLRALLQRRAARMREVEAELVGPHGRAGLADVVAEHLLQHLVEEVRRRVVRLRRVADAPRDDGADAVALGEAFALKDELLVVLEPQRVDEVGARAVLLLDPARVGDLAAARRIERRLGELDLEVAVAEVGVAVIAVRTSICS